MWLFLIGASLGSLLAAVMHKLKAYIECRNHTVTGTTTEALGHNDLSKSKTEALGHSDLRTSKTEALGHSDLNKFQTEALGHKDPETTEISGHSNLIEAAPEVRGDRYEDNSTLVPTPAVLNSLGKQTWNYELDLHRHVMCNKNPGHTDFTPVNFLSLRNLPEGYRDNVYLDFIKAMIGLTIQIRNGYVSVDRPVEYPLSSYRGRRINAFGSGWVCKENREYSVTDGELCPCKLCEEQLLPGEDKKKQWGEFVVKTAKHVVYDDTECQESVCQVDLDSATDRSTVSRLFGVRVEKSNMKFDTTYMTVVTHDRNVCSELKKKLEHCSDLYHMILKTKTKSTGTNYTVCLSHPHGVSKQFSIGEHRGVSEGLPDKWIHTTPTCNGGSGAPVIRLGEFEGLVFPGLISCHSGSHGRESGGVSCCDLSRLEG